MKSKKYMLVVLSIFLILLVFVSSASAADANETDVVSVDEPASTVNEELALDYSSDTSGESNDTVLENNENILATANNDVENDEILQNPNSDDVLGISIYQLNFPSEITIGEKFDFYVQADVEWVSWVKLLFDNQLMREWPGEGSRYNLDYTYQGPTTGMMPVTIELKSRDGFITAETININIKAPPILYINATAASSGDGRTKETPFKTLKEALEVAENDTIMIASGEYKGTNNTGLVITKNLNFIKYGDDEVIFDAESQRRIWTVSATSINITGLTFKNGKLDYPLQSLSHGGALYFENSMINSNINATFINNTATGKGGALYFNDDLTNVNITGTYIDNNANEGGAIYIFSKFDANTTVKDAIFINNNNYAILTKSRNITASDCWFGNNATNYNRKPEAGNVTMDNWLFLNATVDSSEIRIGENSTITFKLESYNSTLKDTGKYGGPINIMLNLTQTLGELDKDTASLGEEITYTAKKGGNASVTGTFETASYTLELKIKTPTEINITNDEVDSGATLTPVDAGNLTYTSSNPSVAIVENGKIKGIKQGEANITVSFAGNEYYAAADNKTIAVAVSLNDASVTVNNETLDLKVGENFTIVATTMPEGLNVTYVQDDSGVYIVDNGVVTALRNGTGHVLVKIGDDEVYAKNSTEVTVIVSLNDASVAAENMELYVGDNATIEYTTDPDGLNVTFVPDESGVYSIDEKGVVTALEEGTGSIIITVGDGKKYAINSTNVTVTVSKIPTEILIQNDTLDMGLDDVVDPVVTLKPSDAGNLSFKVSDENVILVNGSGVVTSVGEGNATVLVSFPGNDNYLPSNATIAVTVKEIIIVEAPDVEKYYHGPERFVVNVTNQKGTPLSNRSVAIVINGVTYSRTTDENGTASIALNLNSGIYDVTSTVDNQSVNSVVTILPTVAGSDVTKVYDETAAYNATFLDTAGKCLPEGTIVSFNINGQVQNETISDDNGLASFNINLPVGEYTVTAVNPVTGEKTSNAITVTWAESNIVVSGKNITVSEVDAVIADIVLPGDATGNVSVTIGDNTTVYDIQTSNHTGRGGKTVMFISNNGLDAGEYNISATYEGDNNYKASTGSDKFVVSGKESLNIEANAEPITAGEDATVKVTGLENATGNVSVRAGDGIYFAPIVDGTATVVIPDLKENVTADVTYEGDANYNPASTSVDIEVDDKYVIVISDVEKYYHGPERFYVDVFLNDEGLANETVNITLNGVTYQRKTDENGTASIGLNLNSGNYTVTVKVADETLNATVTIKSTVNGTDVVKMYGNETQYYATFLDSEGNYLAEGTTVNFNINGVMYERKVSGDKGQAKLNINLPAGEYVITAMNPETGENAANNITVLPTVVENRDITKYYKNGTQYTVKVLGADGKAVGAGENVTFNVNGVLYTRQTNASGIAKLNINLPPADYVITAEYNGYKVANNIKVLPVLTAKDLVKKYGVKGQFVATLVDGQGKPYDKQSVQFNVNGVLYNRGTDSAGQAKLNINLPAGEYIITSSYNGSSISNKITIKS